MRWRDLRDAFAYAWQATKWNWRHRHHQTRESEGLGYLGWWCCDCEDGLVIPK